MKSVTRLSVGLFGVVFHIAAATLLAAKAARAPGGDVGSMFGPALAVTIAAFVVYATIVAPYARKRLGTAKKGIVFFDFLVGMLAEVAVVALAALLFAIISTSGAPAAGAGGIVSQVANAAVLSFLWAIGTAMTEILAVGNAAGFVGFIILKKLATRAAASASPPQPSR